MIRICLLLLSLGFAAGALEAQPAPQIWQVDWGRYYCSLIRPAAEGRPFATAIMVVPGGDTTQIMFIPVRGAAPSGRVSSLRLLPQGAAFDVSLQPERRGQRDVSVVSGLPYDFRDQLAGATELQLRDGEEVRLTIPLSGAAAAVAAHHRCTAQIAQEWGLDEAALAALRRRPATTNLFGLEDGDYPPAALRQAVQGRVLVRVAVSADGRATECATVATSGSPVIDETTCRVVLSRGRFRPALDAEGREVAARMVSSVVWRLPGE